MDTLVTIANRVGCILLFTVIGITSTLSVALFPKAAPAFCLTVLAIRGIFLYRKEIRDGR